MKKASLKRLELVGSGPNGQWFRVEGMTEPLTATNQYGQNPDEIFLLPRQTQTLVIEEPSSSGLEQIVAVFIVERRVDWLKILHPLYVDKRILGGVPHLDGEVPFDMLRINFDFRGVE